MEENEVFLNEEEMNVVKNRVLELEKTEKEHPGLVIERCNGTNKSNRKYFRRVFKNIEQADKCVNWLESQGGYCNCEVLFNVLPLFSEDESEALS